MSKLIVVLSLLLFLQNASWSQVVNIENRRIYDDTSGISGSISASFSAMRNKDLLISSTIRPLIQYKTPKHYYLLLGDWSYSKSSNNTYSNAGMLHFRYAYRIGFLQKKQKNPWKWESYTQVQYNQLLRQKMRALLGTGLRWKMVDNKIVRVFIGTSVFYEHEILLNDAVNKNFRSSTYLSWFFNWKGKWSFSGTNYFQPRLDLFNDNRFMGQYAITYKLRKNIGLRWDANVFYDSRPADNVINTVYNTTFGIQIGLMDN